MKRILIVDDDVVIRITFKKLFDDGEFIIQQARDVKEAVDLLRNSLFDLVLLDLRLPPTGINAGFQILNKKRKIPLNAGTPVIIISGQFDKDTIKNKTALEDNILCILEKPVENAKLLDAIKDALGGKPSQ